jgi:GNAT superfamily N-acetyltransferase
MEYNGYRIELCDFSNAIMMQKLVDLQNAVYTGKHTFTEESFRFWYLDNPNGKVLSFNAWSGETMAAHYAVIPTRMRIDGRIVMGLLSMATVTHPEHRGKGLFKTLAKATYEYAMQKGYEFVVGVANDNSYPGFIKYFPFQDVGTLDVLIGMKNCIKSDGNKLFSIYWDSDTISWRAKKPKYSYFGNNLYGTIGFGPFKKVPFFKTFMGTFDKQILYNTSISCKRPGFRFATLYVGIGSDARKLGYIKAPKVLHKSGFHLIFMDLTNGKLPKMTRDNVFFQLIDFDVA